MRFSKNMEEIHSCRFVRGIVKPPGDKSISHRYAMLGAIADGTTRLDNYAPGQDCLCTLNCLRGLGVPIQQDGDRIHIQGLGLHGLQIPAAPLNAGNSGTTIRLLSGILAAQPFASELVGDLSLSQRPMARIIEPLRRMGAIVEARDGKYPPLKIRGNALQGIDFSPEIPSAQVKSCVLLAGLYGRGMTTVRESVPTRDHTELALRHFGAEVHVSGFEIKIQPASHLTGVDFLIPGDISSAMFWITAGLMLPDSELLISDVGLNPTRNYVLGMLISWGADLSLHLPQKAIGEVAGTISVRCSNRLGALARLEITPEQVPLVIDEIPALAVLGSQTPFGMRIRGAEELRVKESDRLRSVAENLRRMGAEVDEYPDGLEIAGQQSLRGAHLESYGDHRIAMAFAIAALVAQGQSTISDPECVSISYPEFFPTLRRLSMN
jgi:3-phosphoshikimate 1-carboxyvinyltransferase